MDKKGSVRTGSEYGSGDPLGRNPNSHPDPYGAPDGPFGHEMGRTGDGGMAGTTSVRSKGNTFNEK